MKILNKHLFSLGFTLFSFLILSLTACETKKEDSKVTMNKPEPKNWAEKLGFPAGKKVVILHADDIGMCEEANIAVKPMLENKYIQSAAIMMPCKYAEEFVQWAKEHPNMDIGLHLTLTSEWKNYRWGPVADPKEVPSLIDPDGKFWHEVPDVAKHASAEDVEKEIRAQIEKSIALGYKPDHLDTHMGTLYGRPDYVKAFYKVAEEYGIPANAIELSDPKVVEIFRAQGYPIDDNVVKLANNYSLPKVDNFTSAPNAKTYEEKIAKFKKLIQSLQPGLTEIIFHPSVETAHLKSITGSWQQRKWEAQMFGDSDLIKFFKEEGIIFTNWKEIMKRFKK